MIRYLFVNALILIVTWLDSKLILLLNILSNYIYSFSPVDFVSLTCWLVDFKFFQHNVSFLDHRWARKLMWWLYWIVGTGVCSRAPMPSINFCKWKPIRFIPDIFWLVVFITVNTMSKYYTLSVISSHSDIVGYLYAYRADKIRPNPEKKTVVG